MEFTLRSYLGNPYGKGNTTVPNFSAIRTGYLNKLQQIESTISFKWYQYKEKSYICHLTIPSESAEGVRYDVVLEFGYPPKEYNSRSVLDLPLKVFSNAPSFSYTYAHVFLKEKLLCDWLKDKYGKSVRKSSAGVRNAANIIGLEKTLYASALFLSMKGRSDFSYISANVEKISSTNEIEKLVLSQEDVESKYRDVKRQLRIQKEAEKKHQKETKKEPPEARREKHSKSIEKISKSSHVSSGAKSKSTKGAKRTKKI